MSFYVMVTGWVLAYLFKTLGGGFVGLTPPESPEYSEKCSVNPDIMIFWTVLGIIRDDSRRHRSAERC